VQTNAQSTVEWGQFRLTGQDPLVVRASKKLRNDDAIVPVLAGTELRGYLDRIPLGRGNHQSLCFAPASGVRRLREN